MAFADAVLVQVLLGVVPAHGVDAVVDLEHHGGEGPYRGQVASLVDLLRIGVENEGRVRSVLPIESPENQDRVRVYLIAHRQIAWDPYVLILHVDHFPDVFFDVVDFADIRDLFG